MKHCIICIISILVLLTANGQPTDTLTNTKVIQLHKAGFGKEVLKAKIQTSATNFDISIDGMMALKKANVPDEIINLMIASGQSTNAVANSKSPVTSQTNTTGTSINLASGIYYKNKAGEYVEIEPSVLTSTKSNNAAQLLVSRLINSKTKATLSGGESSFEVFDNLPTFIFVFDTSNKSSLNTDNNAYFSAARSPKEFLLVSLEVKKNSREITVGKGNVLNQNLGIDDKFVIQFSSKKLSNGVYEVVPQVHLNPGEYCIMYAQGIKQGESNKVFDFSVKKVKGF